MTSGEQGPVTARESRVFDVVILGAGIVGSSITRVLSRLECSVAVVEKEHDVGMAASAQNSGSSVRG